MDASMAFPCFDQPDLKARFQLQVTAPHTWSVISNTYPEISVTTNPAVATTAFSETEPIPTYLFAFAAGPFVNVHPQPGMPNVWVRKSKAQSAESEVPAVQTTAAEGIQYLSTYFAQPFPFPKYEMVLIPGFAYGGMEHAGATFLREESVLFRTAPTALNRLNRDVLVLHELTHQWFGDFTTMRWFDDLWLKEGFAQYMAYKTLAALRPNDDIWQHFYQSIKPAAYAIDETQGTTPIYQEIPNLDSAKSAYGAIVYSKAPGVLRQLNYVLGDEAFQHGLQLYLSQHKYGNATWSDLIAAFESASSRNLTTWADMWIRHRGMPRIETSFSCDGSHLAKFTLTQSPILGGSDVWPIATEILLGYPDGTTRTFRVDFDRLSTVIDFRHVGGESVELRRLAESCACPAWVFANNNDHAYGLFLLDPKSRTAVMQQLAASTPATQDLFRRTLLWGSFWDSVRQADLDPAAYTSLALEALPNERDESLAASLLGHTQLAAHHYVSNAAQPGLLTQAAALAADRMTNDPDHDLRIVWFRALPGFAAQPPARAVLKDLLAGKRTIPGVELRQQDRWSLVTALIAYNDPEADAFLEAEKKRDPSGDGLKYAWVAHAARPDPATKQQYFREYLNDPQRSEDWIQSSLGAFNYWNQSALTAPYLDPALQVLPQIKRDRKIFFLVAWLDAFIDGQQSPASLDVVNHYLATANPDPDLRLKILQAEDELARTVRIRAKFATE
jgi:aminopeptidase N